MGSLFSKSTTLRKSVRVSNEEFVQLRDFVYEKCGIFVDVKRKYLFESRFSKRLGDLGLPTFSDYFKYLKFDQNKDQELKHLFELVSLVVTSFCRDMRQLEAFRDNVLKDTIATQRAQGQLALNIWSAGCSSGEEPYTLAILLREILGLELAQWKVSITAVDLSTEMINRAKRGVYPEYAFKTTPDELRRKYFKEVDGGWEISPGIKQMVTFNQMNLNDPLALKRVPRSHIVFCRNVIIYFDDAMKKKVVGAFYDNLQPGGYLMIGHSESLHRVSQVFKPVSHPGTIAYKKEA